MKEAAAPAADESATRGVFPQGVRPLVLAPGPWKLITSSRAEFRARYVCTSIYSASH